MDSELTPENKQSGQDERTANGTNAKPSEIGVKVKPKFPQIVKIILVMDAGIIATIILLAEFSATFGHLKWAFWFYYFAIVNTLGVAAFAAIKHWGHPRLIRWIYLIICITVLPYMLFELSRPDNSGQSIRPTFSIIALSSSLLFDYPTSKRFLLWANGNPGNVVIAPIPISFWAEFTNLKGASMAISSSQFEGESTNGTWTKMETINPNMGWIYYAPNGDLNHARRYDPGQNVYPDIFRGKTINPGEPIDGWVFLDTPKNGFDGNIRFRIKDSADNESVEFVSRRNRTNMLATATLNAPPLNLTRPDDFRDISNARLVDYGQMFDPSSFPVEDKLPEQSYFKLPLIIESTVIGGGILWMCIGWIFFQKRKV